jgi:type IX secretion system PorP/SprF family membrane protein
MKQLYSGLSMLLLLILMGSSSVAQDIHFSQYLSSSMTLNPATIGQYNGDWQVGTNYRKQWSAIAEPFTTLALSGDKQFLVRNHRFNVGLAYIYDRSGAVELTSNRLYAAGSYQFRYKGHELYAGVQGGYVNKTFSSANLSFPEQFDQSMGEFNSALAYSGVSYGESLSYVDLNSGVMWTKQFGRIKPEVGVAVFHLNKPEESFYNDGSQLEMRKVIHGKVRIFLNEKMHLTPNFLLMGHAEATDFLLGSQVEYKLSENEMGAKYLYGGLLWRDGIQRVTDAIIVIGGIRVRNFKVGLSYDINTSGLTTATGGRGGYELSLIFISPNTKVNQKAFPCERY